MLITLTLESNGKVMIQFQYFFDILVWNLLLRSEPVKWVVGERSEFVLSSDKHQQMFHSKNQYPTDSMLCQALLHVFYLYMI